MFSLYKLMVAEKNGRDVNVVIPTPFGILLALYLCIVVYSVWFTVGKGEQAVIQRLARTAEARVPAGRISSCRGPSTTTPSSKCRRQDRFRSASSSTRRLV